MKKIIFLALAMIAFSGCDKANSAECPDIRWGTDGYTRLYMTARDDISIHNIIINRGNCMYSFNRGFYRNGVDKIHYGDKPLIDMVESIKNENGKERAYEALNAGPKKLPKSIDLKFGEEESISIECKPLEVVFETNLGQCEYKF